MDLTNLVLSVKQLFTLPSKEIVNDFVSSFFLST